MRRKIWSTRLHNIWFLCGVSIKVNTSLCNILEMDLTVGIRMLPYPHVTPKLLQVVFVWTHPSMVLFRDSPETPLSTGFCCVVLRASSIKECEDVVCRIGEMAVHTRFRIIFLNRSLVCRFSSQLLGSSIQSGLYDCSAPPCLCC